MIPMKEMSLAKRTAILNFHIPNEFKINKEESVFSKRLNNYSGNLNLFIQSQINIKFYPSFPSILVLQKYLEQLLYYKQGFF